MHFSNQNLTPARPVTTSLITSSFLEVKLPTLWKLEHRKNDNSGSLSWSFSPVDIHPGLTMILCCLLKPSPRPSKSRWFVCQLFQDLAYLKHGECWVCSFGSWLLGVLPRRCLCLKGATWRWWSQGFAKCGITLGYALGCWKSPSQAIPGMVVPNYGTTKPT